jgi:two-component system, chemotaxis family, sensor kinase CheA
MNEFIEQFLLEARELVEQATDDLLALEERAADANRIDSLFRAFHTLKGAAGIVDFLAMGRALHAAEEVLSEVRGGSKTVSPKLVNDGLACVDQVIRWLDEMQTNGQTPTNADAAADEIVRRFMAEANSLADTGKNAPDDAELGSWLKRLCADRGEDVAQSRSAFCFRPDAEAFFRGEDPLAVVARIPGLRAVDLAWRGMSGLENMDPFSCAVDIAGLADATEDEVRATFDGIVGRLEIVDLPDLATSQIPPQARLVLQGQVLLLQEGHLEGKAGRLAAAGRVASNVLRHLGMVASASEMDAILVECLADEDAAKLAAAIENVIEEKPANQIAGSVDSARPNQIPASRVLRVDAARIDALVNLTGELTVVKNAYGHIAALAQSGAEPKDIVANLRAQQALFDRLVGELQRAVLQIRVLPLRQVFQRFPRQAREISTNLGKPVKFVTEGDDTEADATIVESLFEPLLHVIRNAIDHGIEAPARRHERGKPPTAAVTLRARRHLENVIVEVEDDGGGIDVDRVREVAIARNVLSSDVVAKMADAEVVALIFAPGFSTASEVTGLSGRGVGMDSVKTAVERVGGNVTVDSRPGQGTTIRLTLPFTVMMTRVMTVEAAGQVFGFPLDTVVETAAVAREHLVSIGLGRAFVLRDRTVPLVDLAASLGLARSAQSGGEAKVVVTSAAGQLGGIEVDRLGERMDVMLKPMDGLLKNMRGVAGTTLLGDGRVLIVLDVQELFQ